MTVRALTLGNYGLPAGAWRWVAMGFVLLALAAAGLAVGAPDASRWAGVALLAGIGAVASIFLYAIWPREAVSADEARLIAEAAARANVAWAVTGADGAVIDCNDIYRGMSGTAKGDAPPPPELALGNEASAATLYRLTKSAADREQKRAKMAQDLDYVPVPDNVVDLIHKTWSRDIKAAGKPVYAPAN